MYAKNAWKKYNEKELKEVFNFSEGYKEFLTQGKTERECVKKAVEYAEAAGFKNLLDCKNLKKGDRVYATNRGKNFAAFVIGEKGLEEGLRVLGAHIDSPRLDVKQNPLYEKDGFCLMDTHYYGGIKKYLYVTIPLAIHGVVVKKNGEIVEVNIGEDSNDPVVGITDLLIHLSADLMSKPAAKVVEGEDLDLNVGSIPNKDDEKEAVKNNILKLLKDKYGIEEEDFLSSELEIVPAGATRDFGLDRSMIAGYGHDDRVCAYTSLMAVLHETDVTYTSCAVLVDKEEVGSIGATGAQSRWFENVLAELLDKTSGYTSLKLRSTLTHTKMLSSDVSAGYDPLYASVNDSKNSAYLGNGLCFNKYTGSRGKGGCNDAMPEFIAEIRNALDNANVNYQTSELGKVDQGGGGTIAYILGNLNMNVIDAGIAVLSMHSPMEIVSKADVYEAYKGYRTFITKL